jgi:hypothetical protein
MLNFKSALGVSGAQGRESSSVARIAESPYLLRSRALSHLRPIWSRGWIEPDDMGVEVQWRGREKLVSYFQLYGMRERNESQGKGEVGETS